MDRTYEETRDASLPWGYWLRLEPGRHYVQLTDEDGRTWDSVRAALWYGRLGFRDRTAGNMDTQMERLLAVLLALDRRSSVNPVDLFHGERHFAFFYLEWLLAHGLIGGGHRETTVDAKPMAEGRAIARMLMATRPAELADLHPGAASILRASHEEIKEIDRKGFADMNGRMQRLRFLFTREDVCGRPAVVLLHRDLGADMPLIRTIWMQTLSDPAARDRLFGWFLRHVDRWTAWGERALSDGSAAFGSFLFELAFADDPRAEASRPTAEVIALPYRPASAS